MQKVKIFGVDVLAGKREELFGAAAELIGIGGAISTVNPEILANSLENDEREKTGIKNLRIGYNRVFGYYIEVTNSFKDKVPYEYQRRQTLANAERYITDELKDLEIKILSAEEKSLQLENNIFGNTHGLNYNYAFQLIIR